MVARCTPGDVRIWQFNTTGGLAGSAGDLFWIRYEGVGQCSLSGYPTLTFLGAHGQALHVAVKYLPRFGGNDQGGLGPRVAVPTVVLTARRDLASFWLFGSDTPGGNRTCISSTEVAVSLPGQRAGAVVPAMRGDSFPWCGFVLVHPVVAGRSGNDPARSLAFFFGHPQSAS